MKTNLILYGLALLVFLAFDAVWLGLVAPGFYQRHLGFLLRDQPNWLAAGLFYPLFVGGLLVFVIRPARQAGSAAMALRLGAFFGLVTYATYDLTNMATVAGWPWLVTGVDLAWGALLSAVVSLVVFRLARRLR